MRNPYPRVFGIILPKKSLGAVSHAWLACSLLAVAAGARDTLKVFDWNLWQWNMGVTRLEAIIRASGANIAGLNEAWIVRNNNQIAANLKWSIAYGGLDGGSNKNETFWINGYHMPQVLMSAFPMTEKKYFNIVDENDENIPDATRHLRRGATLGRLTVPTRAVHVLVLHLNPWEETWAVDEIKEILGFLAPLAKNPIIVMGDFNTRSHKDGATGADAQVHQAMEAAGFVDSHWAMHPVRGSRIDFIYANKYLKPIKSVDIVEGVFGSRGDADSDHPGVYSEFVFTPGCTDPKAGNYNAFAVEDDGSCKTTGLRRSAGKAGVEGKRPGYDALGRDGEGRKRPAPTRRAAGASFSR